MGAMKAATAELRDGREFAKRSVRLGGDGDAEARSISKSVHKEARVNCQTAEWLIAQRRHKAAKPGEKLTTERTLRRANRDALKDDVRRRKQAAFKVPVIAGDEDPDNAEGS